MAKGGQPTDMGELLAYFEERSRLLDAEGQHAPDKPTLQFMSLIKFDGVPILPPVLSEERRKEMQMYKHEAVKRHSQTRAKKREELHAKVQSIVAGVEERRAAKQASKSLSPASSDRSQSSTGKASLKQQHSSEVVTRLSTKSSPSNTSKSSPNTSKTSPNTSKTSPNTSKSSPNTSKSSPIELPVNIPKSSATASPAGKESTVQAKVSSAKASVKSSAATAGSKSSPKTSPARPSSSSAKSTFSNFKSLGKLGHLSRQKSFSSQHLDRAPSRLGRDDSDHSSSSGKDASLSPNSKSMLPHPPDGKPRYRNSSMRQSASTPDLRTIDFSVKTEDLKKPLPSSRRALSPKGGRPQAPDRSTDEKNTSKKSDEKSKKLDQSSKLKPGTSKLKPNQVTKESEKLKEQKAKKIESDKSKTSGIHGERKPKQGNEKSPVPSKSKTSSSKVPLQNPLEILEQEITRMEESERNKNQRSGASKQDVRPELDPIQTAAAELFPFPISEEQALATLDSLHSDFQSLDQADSLPVDYNGIPLTNMKQQQIIHMLTKLSKALNIEDTLTSTTSSNMSDMLKDNRQSQEQSSRQSGGDNRSVQNGANNRGYGKSEVADTGENYDDSYINVTNDSTNTAPSSNSLLSTSVSSNHSRARMSPTGSSSILSSASSVSASRSRMSPKTLKNTVHFSSFVTEISTSASQSYEDKISFRKMDITPKSSENFEEGAQGTSENDPQNFHSPGSNSRSSQGESMLNKVALSPSVDSSTGSPGEFHGQAHPFEGFQEGDLNTSDKENEFVPQGTESSDENSSNEQNVRPTGRGQQVLNVYTANIPPGPIGDNHPALMKCSVKSDISETSTLKDFHEQISSQANLSKYNMTMDTQYRYGTGGTELDKYMQKTASNSSTSSMQEEITRSYLMSQQKPERELIYAGERFDVTKPIMRTQSHSPELDESAILLKPVIYSHSQTSIVNNRSMLEEEEKIRSNLEKVQLEDDSDEDNSDYEEHDVADVDNEMNEEEDDTDDDESHTDSKIKVAEQEDDEPEQVVEPELPEPIKTGEVEEEEEGKAEHIQKYLNQVHEQSLQQEDFDDVEPSEPTHDVMDIGNIIQSFTSTIQSMNHLSQEDLFRIQAEQFETLQKQLIEQQRSQLEELFISQRREQMKLQTEIETYQQNIHQQDDIDTIQLQESLRPQISQSLPQTTQAWQFHNQAVTMSPPFPVQPVASAAYGSNPNMSGMSCNTSYNAMPYQDPRMGAQPGMMGAQPGMMGAQPGMMGAQPGMMGAQPGMMAQPGMVSQNGMQQRSSQGMMFADPRTGMPGEFVFPRQYDPNLSEISHNTSYSTIPPQNAGGRGVKSSAMNSKPAVNRSGETGTSQNSNQFSYPTSPNQFTNHKDTDNMSEESGFTKATPKQLDFSNHSTPVPKIYKPILHSPVKKPSHQTNGRRAVIPEEVFNPAMQPKFDRVSAVVKGYLTRRLLKTAKVQETIKTINDTRNFAFSFQSETPIKKGTYTREDMGLLERIIAQLQAALLDIHEIFFIIPVSERMALIAMSRQLDEERRLRESRSSHSTMSLSHPRISTATQKARERKRKAQLAEEAVFGSVEFRPKSAPPTTSSPHSSTDVRALRPIQGQISPIHPDGQITVREVKERPKTATDRQKSGSTANKSKKTAGSKATKTNNKSASSNTTTSKQKTSTVVPSKTKKMDKAWR